MGSSLERRIVRMHSDRSTPWVDLQFSAGEELGGQIPTGVKALASLIHLSDIHICDAASPARLEYLDRMADPDNPLSQLLPYVGSYRAQEFLSTQVFEAMIRAVNAIPVSPTTGNAIDSVVITGDVIDNAQANELEWYHTILEGGQVNPKSGHATLSEAAHSWTRAHYDQFYYHPDGPEAGEIPDRPHLLHGFPHFKGLRAAAEERFVAEGLRHNWLAVHGNHDALIQGSYPPDSTLNELLVGDKKLVGIGEHLDLQQLLEGYGEVGPVFYPPLDDMKVCKVTPDDTRVAITIEEWNKVHTKCGHDHGLDSQSPTIAYYYRDFGSRVRVICLDTVNAYGGWQGSLDRQQFDWLDSILQESQDLLVVIASHHPLKCLFNDYVPEGIPKPAVEKEIRSLLSGYSNILLWFAGHLHDNKISRAIREDGTHNFWEIRTASHIDWPQQGRLIEICETVEGEIVIATSMIDHAGPLIFSGTTAELNDPVGLAGFSRELAANDWQRYKQGPHSFLSTAGETTDRNMWLWCR